MINNPFICSVPEKHFGLTWSDTKLCSIHRTPDLSDLSKHASRKNADEMYAEFEEIFRPNIKAESPDIANRVIQNAIESFTTHAATAAAARAIISLDVADMEERYNKAWYMRENIAASLFPYPFNDKEAIIVATTEQVDKYGRSTESNRRIISYLISLYWAYNANTGVTKSYIEGIDFSDAGAYIEYLGNFGTGHSIHPAVGKVLYLHEAYTKEAFGSAPKNLEPHHHSLVVVPEAYKAFEAQKAEAIHRLETAKAVEAKKAQAAQIAANKAKTAAVVGGVASILGGMITSAENKSNRKAAQKRQDQDNLNRNERHRATQLWLEREEANKRRRDNR